MGRSHSISEPLVDKDGKGLTEGKRDSPVGAVVLASHDRRCLRAGRYEASPSSRAELATVGIIWYHAGQSVYHDPPSDRDVMVHYHARKNETPVGGTTYFGVNYIDFSGGGPVLVD